MMSATAAAIPVADPDPLVADVRAVGPTTRLVTLVNLVVLGRSGSGKSTLTKTLLSEQHFPEAFSPFSLTLVPERLPSMQLEIEGRSYVFTVYDTPGVLEYRNNVPTRVDAMILNEIAVALSNSMPEVSAFVICQRVDSRLDQETVRSIIEYARLIGESSWDRTFLCLTHCDQMTEDQCLQAYRKLSNHFRNVDSFPLDTVFGEDGERVIYSSAHDRYLYGLLQSGGHEEARRFLAEDVLRKRATTLRKLSSQNNPVRLKNTNFYRMLRQPAPPAPRTWAQFIGMA